jgi:hypothetical protein
MYRSISFKIRKILLKISFMLHPYYFIYIYAYPTIKSVNETLITWLTSTLQPFNYQITPTHPGHFPNSIPISATSCVISYTSYIFREYKIQINSTIKNNSIYLCSEFWNKPSYFNYYTLVYILFKICIFSFCFAIS